MNSSGVKVGVILGMVSAVAGFFPIFRLTLGHCFWEQGCEPHENLRVLGVFLALCISGLAVGWLSAHIYTLIARRLSRS